MTEKVAVEKINPVFEDHRGKIMDLLDDEIILHVGMLTSRADSIRGNHYHKKAKQFNYIIKGTIELTTWDPTDPNPLPDVAILRKGDFVSIPAGIAHTMKALEDSEFLDLNTESRSNNAYEEDTFRVTLDG